MYPLRSRYKAVFFPGADYCLHYLSMCTIARDEVKEKIRMNCGVEERSTRVGNYFGIGTGAHKCGLSEWPPPPRAELKEQSGT
mmetsp:Transcript_12167/g.25215  ORF Transcript_12167/g.25215 Transcript_12167/m.25215 type:complete len:83 (-) Transcript_12167:998-1246(-)